MRNLREPGNTLSEYAIIIGLLSLLGVGGLKLLGNSVSVLLAGAAKGTNSHSMQSYLASTVDVNTGQNGGGSTQPALQQQGQAVTLNGGPNLANPSVSLDSANPLTGNATGGGTNATSVDGVGMVKEQADRLTRLVQQI